MKDVSLIDKNFKIETKIGKNDIRFYNVLCEPFRVYGVIYENGCFRRMPEKAAKTISEGVYALHTNTAGGRVRFKTDSAYVAVNVKMNSVGKMGHFTLAGSAGFDMYVKEEKERHISSFIPPINVTTEYESVAELGNTDMKEITINFPLYSDVSELYIGVSESSAVLAPEPYKTQAPIVFYGSSITQGGCASRPGNAYTAVVARELECDHINLGFSGSALAEDEMARYIAELDMCAFVFDYDHNAPSLEHLEMTHEKMFKTIRAEHPSIPIVIMSRPKYTTWWYEDKCSEIIKMTYRNAVAAGDKNVYFLDGRASMAIAENEGTVDGCHPNDLGFASMARAVIEILRRKR